MAQVMPAKILDACCLQVTGHSRALFHSAFGSAAAGAVAAVSWLAAPDTLLGTLGSVVFDTATTSAADIQSAADIISPKTGSGSKTCRR